MEIIYRAVERWLDAKAERITAETQAPHYHDWELLEKVEMGLTYNPRNKWNEYLYRCKGCCECKTVKREV